MASTYLPAAVQPTLSSQEKHTREVLLASLSGKPFEDLKFYAFSRRTSAGQIDQPLPILANSTLIRHTSPHFNEVLVVRRRPASYPLPQEAHILRDPAVSFSWRISHMPLGKPSSFMRTLYNIPALNKRAADDIKSKLGPDNIFEELFGTFTSLYPEIQEMQINYLYEHIQDPTVREKLPKWMEALAEGRLHGGAAGIFSGLILKF